MKRYRNLFLLLLVCVAVSCRDGRELTVLQMNVWQEAAVVEGGFDAVADEICRLSPDIVLLSESSGEFVPNILRELSERGENYYGEKSRIDVGILSKYKITEQYEVAAPLAEAVRVVKAKIDVEGCPVVVYSAHLDYTHYACYMPRGYSGVSWKKMDAPVLDESEIERVNNESLRDETIQGVIEDAAGEEGSMILLGGDFNEPSHLDWTESTKDLWDHNGTVVRWICSTMLEENGFKDAYREMYPDAATHPGFTFPSDNPAVDVSKLTWAPEADERDRIDFVYYKPNGRCRLIDAAVVGPRKSVVRSQRVEETSKDKFIEPAGVWPTDHKAVWATFRLMY